MKKSFFSKLGLLLATGTLATILGGCVTHQDQSGGQRLLTDPTNIEIVSTTVPPQLRTLSFDGCADVVFVGVPKTVKFELPSSAPANTTVTIPIQTKVLTVGGADPYKLTTAATSGTWFSSTYNGSGTIVVSNTSGSVPYELTFEMNNTPLTLDKSQFIVVGSTNSGGKSYQVAWVYILEPSESLTAAAKKAKSRKNRP